MNRFFILIICILSTYILAANIYNRPGATLERRFLANNTRANLNTYLDKNEFALETDHGCPAFKDYLGNYWSIIGGPIRSGWIVVSSGGLKFDSSTIFDSAGFIGIGTTFPHYQLQVVGSIRADTSISVPGGGYFYAGGSGISENNFALNIDAGSSENVKIQGLGNGAVIIGNIGASLSPGDLLVEKTIISDSAHCRASTIDSLIVGAGTVISKLRISNDTLWVNDTLSFMAVHPLF